MLPRKSSNILDFWPQRQQKRSLRIREINNPLCEEPEPPMTQIIGIICREYILVASESQYTAGKKKTLEAQKINAIKFKNYEGALVAEGGSVKTSNRVIHYVREMAAETTIDSEISVSQIAEKAMEKTRQEILSLLPSKKENYSDGELEGIFTNKKRFCGLLIAYYFNRKPCLYTIYLNQEHAEPQSSYALLGCDNDLAELF